MAVIYITPAGGGTQSGTTIANAKPLSALNVAITAAGPGGTINLVADLGNYSVSTPIQTSAGGTAAAPVTIRGVDSSGNRRSAVIVGNRAAVYTDGMTPGSDVFRLQAGSSHLLFKDIDFANVGCAFRLGGDCSNLTLQDMYADNVRFFVNNFVSGGSTTATVTGFTMRNVEVHGFSKSVVRLQYDTNTILIDNVFGDSEYEDGDHFAMGIFFDGTVHNGTVKNCTMKNAKSSVTSYWNGDGFTNERGCSNLRYENCWSEGNADGGYDFKSSTTVIAGCVSKDNGRNFRLWGGAQLIDSIGLDPHKRGGTTTQTNLWVSGTVDVLGGWFADSGSASKIFYSDGGTIRLNSVNAWYAGSLVSGTGISGQTPSLQHVVPATGSWSTNGADYLPAGWDSGKGYQAAGVVNPDRALGPPRLVNTNTVQPPVVQTLNTLQTLKPALLASTSSFAVATVSAVGSVKPPLVSEADSFYTPTISGGVVTLKPALVSEADSFYRPVVVSGVASLHPSALTSTTTLYGPVVQTFNSPQTLRPNLVSDANMFAAPLVQIAGRLLPSLVSDADGFFAPSVTGGVVTLRPVLAANNNTVPGPALFSGIVGLFPPALASAVAVYAPDVTGGAVVLEPPLLTGGEVYPPALTGGDTTIIPLLLRGQALFAIPEVTAVIGGSETPPVTTRRYHRRVVVPGPRLV